MPVTTSDIHEVPLGTSCPPFSLVDVATGNTITREGLVNENPEKGSLPFIGLVVIFMCNHCPVVGSIRTVLAAMSRRYQAEGIRFLAIMPNETAITPMNGPDEMKAEHRQFQYSFPYCFDGDVQDVSRAFGAVVTPDFFVYDKGLKLIYRGCFDNSRPRNQGVFQPDKNLFSTGKVGQAVDGSFLAAALDGLVGGQGKLRKGVVIPQHPSEGCSVKWLRNAKEPSWSMSEYDLPENLAHHLNWNKRYLRWKRCYDITFFLFGYPLSFFGIYRPALGNELTEGGI